ncbi:MAG: hypothetical protein ACE5HP_12975 [Gemmatimonadota bacterium]
MATVKNNLSPFAPTIGFYVIGRDVPVAAGPPESVAAIEWSGPLDLTADQLISRQKSQSAGALETAIAFLRRVLADGPRLKKEVVAAGEELDLSERTLQRALKSVGHSDGNTRGAMWSLNETDGLRGGSPPDLSDLTRGGGEDEDR